MQEKPKKLPNSNKKVAKMRKLRKLDGQKRRVLFVECKKFIHSFANEKMLARSNLLINSRISPSGEHFAYEEKVGD